MQYEAVMITAILTIHQSFLIDWYLLRLCSGQIGYSEASKTFSANGAAGISSGDPL